MLLHALAARPARRAGPRRAGRGRGPRRQQGPVRLAQDEGVAREVGRHRQQAPGLPHHGGRTAWPAHTAGRGSRCTPGRPTRSTCPTSSCAASAAGSRAPIYAATWPTCAWGASWNYACLLVDPCSREIVGRSAGPGKDARPVKSEFATLSFPISDIEVFHTDRGSEFDNAEIDLMLEAFGIEHQVDLGQGLPQRQRRRRADQQDTEGRARPPRDVRHDARAPGRALELRATVRQLQDPLDAGLHVAGRVQGGGAVPPGIFQIGVANPSTPPRSFQRCLDSHGIVQSVSRPGTPLDNAVAESFFKTLKGELAEGRSYGTRDEAKQDIFKYIELYYNRVRMHSTLGYMSPVEYERQYA